MPYQNRVDPAGNICVHPARGEFMGNRGGVLHDADQHLVRHQKGRAWLVCVTEFKGRRRKLMQPNSYTELFFLDEVTALAAGHRPCFECRRQDALAFAEAMGKSRGEERLSAPAIDALLAVERKREPDAPERQVARDALSSLPDGAIIRQGNTHYGLRGGRLLPWSFEGYGAPLDADALSGDPVRLATPPSTVAALTHGYRPAFHSRAWKPAT
ncbi:hypothetical protein [uncultured Hoeflea sp.]|uniref:hypothetical protein n=1 Tax=uncultured Hoeflea sp. TaxID=538666 RepID=UPI0030EE924A|tara:strand:+ start:105060 stop:105698 length:639 start_codon:yes stop_codon:yes gene_type:complete